MTEALSLVKHLVWCGAVLVLGGCALQRTPPPVPAVAATTVAPPTPASCHVTPATAAPGGEPPAAGAAPLPEPEPEPANLLPRWHDELRLMSPEALQRDMARYADTTTGPETPGTAAAAMRQALALITNHGNGDLGRATALLDQVQRSPQPEAQPWRAWARLLQARVSEQRRLEEQVERQSQQLRDSQRRIDLLNDKLEALKAIERSLTPRPARTP